ncbi:L-lactate dehydrogenase (cytochrome) [Diutina catenulata]
MPTYDEVAKHNSKSDCWVIIHGKAYDVTDFLSEHPGGSAIILKYAGQDATKAFDPVHPGDTLTKYLNKKLHLGEVTGTPPKKTRPAKKAASGQAGAKPKKGNHVDEFDVEYDEQEGMEPFPFDAPEATGTSSGTSSGEDDEVDEYGDPLTEDEKRRREAISRMPDLTQIYNLNDFEYVARHTMEKTAWGYYSSGCDDEITLRENHLAYQRIYFKPRVLRDVTNIDLSTTMNGTKVDAPFYITATALGRLGHDDGEKVLTRSAAKQNVIQMIPTLASCSFDEIVDAADGKQTQWLQLYVNKDREVCKEIIQHAEKRGVKGLFITVDAPQLGRREKDMRSKNIEDVSHVQGEGEDADRSQGAARAISSFIDTALKWDDLPWFRSVTKMPIFLKGIQCVEDALLAVDAGVDGIVISNHGGRQLEFAPPPIQVLAELMPILRERGVDTDKFQVYVDGGVRRAGDILKAICLGAKGVGIGRPFLYAMSTYGDDGVYKAIQILKDEMEMNMRLLGVTSISQLDETYLDLKWMNRSIPEDKLFGRVYEPMLPPPFKSNL